MKVVYDITNTTRMSPEVDTLVAGRPSLVLHDVLLHDQLVLYFGGLSHELATASIDRFIEELQTLRSLIAGEDLAAGDHFVGMATGLALPMRPRIVPTADNPFIPPSADVLEAEAQTDQAIRRLDRGRDVGEGE